MHLQFSTSNTTMSVLVPGPDDLKQRVAIGEYEQQLNTWFKAVQEKAWDYVKGSAEKRPEKIFLVTGQLLANEYAICHVQRSSLSCEVSFEANIEVPTVVNAD